MRAIALPIVILMLTATFAGCVGGDPDGDDSSGIDMEILNQMIDDNLQDFINNTTVTVNQDFHYYNNTTIVNNYDSTNNQFNNTTNLDGGEVNNYNTNHNNFSGGSASEMLMFTVEWDSQNIPYDILNHYISSPVWGNPPGSGGNNSGNNSSSSGGSTILYAYAYNNQLVEIRMTCGDAAIQYRMGDGDREEFWENYLVDNYGYSNSDELQNIAETIAYNAERVKDSDAWNRDCEMYDSDNVVETTPYYFSPIEQSLFSIDLNAGEVLQFLTLNGRVRLTLDCSDGFHGSSTNGSIGSMIGGQTDCVLTGSAVQYWEIDAWFYEEGGVRNWYSILEIDGYNTPPSQFAVYYEILFASVDMNNYDTQ